MKKTILIAAICIGSKLNAQSQMIIRNLGFEHYDAKGNMLSWDNINSKQKYTLNIDSNVSHSGKQSFSITPSSDTETDRGMAGAASMVLSRSFGKLKNIKVSAHIKTQNLTEGVAVLIIRLNGEKEAVFESDTREKSPTGTTDWKNYELESPLTPDVKSISFGFLMTGKGKVWFDDFEILIDGKPVADSWQ